MSIPYKGFCWSLGTTSFRTKSFNKTIEEQLFLLNEFWAMPGHNEKCWAGNNDMQANYYDFMHEKGFVKGTANNKSKDAREKTSGLVDIGLIDDERRLTEAGLALLKLSTNSDFKTDNFFQIPKDSLLFLRQLLKTSCTVNSDTIRPFIVLIYVLSKVESLSSTEYKYLLPLCTSNRFTSEIIAGIKQLRSGTTTIDELIIRRLIDMDNYQDALELFLQSEVDEALLCEIGFNRKSRNYDAVYFRLYQHLYSAYVDKDATALPLVYSATKDVKIGKWWRSYLFNTTSETAINRHPASCKRATVFDGVSSEREFKIAFFKTLHLFKAKATLSDYYDLNRRYIQTTDIVLFQDDEVKLDIVPKHFFGMIADELYTQAYTVSEKLGANCSLAEISNCLVIDEPTVIASVNKELGSHATTMEEARNACENDRYKRLQHLIDTKFTDEKILTLLNDFETRNDSEISSMVTDNADIPTIFEYVLGILWYKASERQGKILNYMKLSLDVNLLPKSHANGGDADIVYEYPQTNNYPEHALLLEATLSDNTNQRRMEMEPVSRHLGRHLLHTGNLNSYCVFAANYIDINVLSDFRGRKSIPFYDTQDYSKSVSGMKIIPLQTSELKKIVMSGKTYKELYKIFEEAFHSVLPPHEWYEKTILL